MATDISETTWICSGSTYGGAGDGFNVLSGATLYVGANATRTGIGTITSATVCSGAIISCGQGNNDGTKKGYASNTTILSGGTMTMKGRSTATNVIISEGGTLTADNANAFEVNNPQIIGAVVSSGGTITPAGYTIFTDLVMSSGAILKGTCFFGGTNTNIDAGVIRQGKAANFGDNFAITNGVITNLAFVGHATVAQTMGIYRGITIDGGTITGKGKTATLIVSKGGVVSGTMVNSGGILRLDAGTGINLCKTFDVVVNDGGVIINKGAAMTNTEVFAGGTASAGAANINLGDITMHGGAMITGAANVTAGAINIAADAASGVYTLADGVLADTVTVTIAGYSADTTVYNLMNSLKYNIDNSAALTLTAVETTDADFEHMTDQTSLKDAAAIATNNGTTRYGIIDSNTTANKFYAAEGLISDNVAVKIAGLINPTAQIYGGGSTASLDGDALINFTSGNVAALMGGAENNTVAVSNATLEIGGNASASVVYGAGRGNVAGGVNVNVFSGATVTGQLYGGGVLLSNATTDLVIEGDVTLNIDGGTFGGDIVGGNRINGGSAGTGIISGTIALNVSGGTLAASKSVYGGGFAASSGATDTEIDVQSGVVINWNGGIMAGEAANGRGVFGGALAANGATAKVASVNIAVTDGNVTNIFGGGWSQSDGASEVTGNVNISVSGGSVANIFGGGAHADGESGTTTVGGDVMITISGGSVNKIFAAGQQDGDEITGVTSVVFTGSTDFSTTVSGAGYQGANADAMAYLTFDAYTGSFTGSIANFDMVKISGETAATLTGAEIINGAWNFDLAANTGASTLLTWSDAENIGTSLELAVSTSNAVATGWNLIAGGTETNFSEGITYTLAIDGEAAIDLTLGQEVSGTGTEFDGYMLYEDNGDSTLKFGKLA